MAEEKKEEATKEEASVEETKSEEAPKEEAKAPEAPKAEEKAEAPAPKEEASEEVEVPAKFKKIVDEIESMSVIDLNELVKIFEKKFGVSATAVAAAPGAAAGGDDEGSDSINVELTDAGGNKIGVIKAVKDALGLGLKEAKDLVDGAPAMLKTEMKKEEAEELKGKIEEAGGKVTFK